MRRFLQANKVYFDTVVAILLGVMALVVSVSQAFLAYKSYELSRLPYLPEIAANVTVGDGHCGPESWQLVTTNLSGNAYDVTVRSIAFLSIRELQLLKIGQRPSSDVTLDAASIPLRGYFAPGSFVSGSTRGELVIQCTEPLNEMDRAEHAFKSLSDKRNNNPTTLSVDVYVAVRYQNRFGDRQVKYFEVNAEGQAVPLSIDSGQVVFNRYTKMVEEDNYLDYGSSTGEDIMRVWRMNAS